MEEHNEVEIERHSFELHPAGVPPISPKRQVRIITGRLVLQKRAREQDGLARISGLVGTDSQPSCLRSTPRPRARSCISRPMRTYWEQARGIGKIEVLRVVVEEVGLNTKDFEQMLDSDGFNMQVNADLEITHASG